MLSAILLSAFVAIAPTTIKMTPTTIKGFMGHPPLVWIC